MTPKELAQHIEAVAWRYRFEHDQNMRLAYTIASLSRAKRMPSIRKLLSPPPKAKPLRGEELAQRQDEFNELTERMRPDAARE